MEVRRYIIQFFLWTVPSVFYASRKKKLTLILQLHSAPLIPHIYAHFYRGKIERFCLKWRQKVNTQLGEFKMALLVSVETAEDFT